MVIRQCRKRHFRAQRGTAAGSARGAMFGPSGRWRGLVGEAVPVVCAGSVADGTAGLLEERVLPGGGAAESWDGLIHIRTGGRAELRGTRERSEAQPHVNFY